MRDIKLSFLIGAVAISAIFLAAKDGIKNIRESKTPEELEAAKRKYKSLFSEIKDATDNIFKPSTPKNGDSPCP